MDLEPLGIELKYKDVESNRISEFESARISNNDQKRSEYKRMPSSWDEAESSGNQFDRKPSKIFIPIPFRSWFETSLVGLCIGLMIAMQIILYNSRKENGFSNSLVSFSSTYNSLAGHYLYSAGGVVLSLPILAAFGWVDFEVKLMQPLLELKRHGGGLGDSSILVNYTGISNFLTPISAARRAHFFVLASSLLCLISLAVSPLAAALFYIDKDLMFVGNVTAVRRTDFSFNPNSDLSLAMPQAVGFALSLLEFNVGFPEFFNKNGSIPRLDTPKPKWGTTGLILTPTVLVSTSSNCAIAPNSIAGTNSNYQIQVNSPLCSIQINSTFDSSSLFSFVPCGSSQDPRLDTVAFWKQSLADSAQVAVCSPTIELNRATANLSLVTRALQVESTGPVDYGMDPFLLAPFFGSAINGIFFDTNNSDSRMLARIEAGQQSLAQTFYKSVETVVSDHDYLDNVTTIYSNYLSAFSAVAYYSDTAPTPQLAQLFDFVPRLKAAEVAAHTLAAIFAVLALGGGILFYYHRRARKGLPIRNTGSLASSAQLMSQLATYIQPDDDIEELFKDESFVLVEGQVRIASNASERARRRSSIFKMPFSPTNSEFPNDQLRKRMSQASTAKNYA